MGSMSVWHWVILLVVVLLLFGTGRLSSVMGDAAKGIKAFKKGMAEDDTPPARLPEGYAPPPPPAHGQPVAAAAAPAPVVHPIDPAHPQR